MTERARTTERTQTGIERDGEHRWERSDTIWSLALALIATVTAAILSSTVFGRIPHVQDSIAQLFQARIFAGGHLTAPAPVLPEFFAYHHMILTDGRWYSQYPPGHALSLLLGVVLHAPWLVNPVLGGVAVFATYLLGMETLGRPAARLGAGLALVSPFLLLMSAEFMAHATTLATLTLFLALHLRAVRTGSRFAAWASALLLAWGILARPYSALGFTIPVAMLALWNLRKGASARQALIALGVGGVLGGALLLAYNAGTTGDPFLFGYEKLYGASHGLGFGKGTWGPPHTLARGLLGFLRQIGDLHHRIFEWPIGSLWPLLVGLLPGLLWGRRLFLVTIPLSLGFVHVFYWYRDDCFGPRYWYEGMGPMLLLTAAGMLRIRDGLRRVWLRIGGLPTTRSDPKGSGGIRRRRNDASAPATSSVAAASASVPATAPATAADWISGGVLAVLILSGLVWGWPALFRPPAFALGQPPESAYRQASYFAYFGPQYWGVGPYLGSLVDSQLSERAIVFCDFAEEPIDEISVRYLWFGSAFAHEEPYLDRARVIYAHDLGGRDQELMARYPDRAAYRYTGTIQAGSLQPLR